MATCGWCKQHNLIPQNGELPTHYPLGTPTPPGQTQTCQGYSTYLIQTSASPRDERKRHARATITV